MNVSEALARLTGLLEDMDAMNTRSIASIEEKLGVATAALEETKHLRRLSGAASPEDDSQYSALQEEIAGYKNRVLELEALVEAAEHAGQERLDKEGELTGALETRDARIQELEAGNESMTARITDLENLLQEKAGLEDQLRDLRAENESREQALESLRGELAEAREQAARAEELEGVVVERDALRSDLAERDTRLERLQEQLEEVRQDAARVQELEQVLREREETAKSLEEKVSGVEAERAEKESALAAACAELESSLEQARRDLESLRADYQARCEELDVHKAGHETARSEVDILRINHQAVTGELEEVKGQMAKMREQLEAMESEKASVEAQMQEISLVKESQAKVNLLLQQREAQVQALEQALINADEHRGKLELQTKMLLGQIEGLQYQQQDMDALKEKIARLEGDLENERALVIRLKAQVTAPAAPKPKMTGQDSDFLMEAPSLVEEAPKKAMFSFERSPRGQRKRIGEILLEADVITNEQLEEALRLKAADPRRRVGTVLVELDYVTEEVVAAALAAQLRMRFIESVQEELDPGVLQFVPSHIARNHRCVPISLNAGTLVVAMANPLDLIAIEDIEIATNARVEPVVAPPSAIDTAIARYYQRDSAVANRR